MTGLNNFFLACDCILKAITTVRMFWRVIIGHKLLARDFTPALASHFFLGYTWQIRTLFKEEIVNTFTNAREERLS